MIPTVYAHNEFHLGDCLSALHLIRALAKPRQDTQFVFFTHGCNLEQLKEVVSDLPNIHLFSFDDKAMWENHKHESVNTWKNYEDFWEKSTHRWDWSSFMLDHHRWTAKRMGFESPFSNPTHLLFDYPALQQPIDQEYDFLVIDAEPHSGQLKPMAQHGSGYLNQFIALLKNAGHRVMTTSECKRYGMTISQIGALSLKTKHVVGVMSGPAWTVCSTSRHHLHCVDGRRTIFMLDNGEQLGLPGIEQCENIEQLMGIALKGGWI